MECGKHKTKKDFSFCLDKRVKDGLACLECQVVDGKNSEYDPIVIADFKRGNVDELKKAFNTSFIQVLQEQRPQDSVCQTFVRILDIKIKGYFENSEKEWKRCIEKVMDEQKGLVQEWKQKWIDRLEQMQFKSFEEIQGQIRDLPGMSDNIQDQQKIRNDIARCNRVAEIQHDLDQILGQFSDCRNIDIQNIRQQSQRCIELVRSNDLNKEIEEAKQLKDCNDNEVRLYDGSQQDLDSLLKKYSWNYRVCIDLNWCDTSLQSKQNIVQKIDQLDANSKVGVLMIRISNGNMVNSKLVQQMVENYYNIYWVYIQDDSDQLDQGVHELLKKLVGDCELQYFKLSFGGKLCDSDDSLEVVKEYNWLMKKQMELKYLRYEHSDIVQWADQKEGIDQLIHTVGCI